MARISTFFMLAFLACLLHDASAACCKRKSNFGCCGNGRCNIFCCNCNRGCNRECEKTRCNTVEWIKCAAVVGKCSAACAGSKGTACAACMGSSFSACAKCYSSGGRRRLMDMTSASTLQDRNAFYQEIAGGHKAITLPKFEVWMQYAHANMTHGATAAGAKSSGQLTPQQVFKSYDINGDGIISRHEFDNTGVKISWMDIKRPKQVAAGPSWATLALV